MHYNNIGVCLIFLQHKMKHTLANKQINSLSISQGSDTIHLLIKSKPGDTSLSSNKNQTTLQSDTVI